jgi:crotonobetainyl-CoA:carnitine CoA-transferase CaiB-like acyl-CoA transferase
MGGVVSLTGHDDGTVLKCGPSVGDLFTGALGAVGLLAAIIDARATGEGQFVDVAMYDAVLSLCEGAAYSYSYTGNARRPTGNGHPTIAPFDIYPTADGHCAIGTPSDRMFATLCERMGSPEHAADDRFNSPSARLANRDQLNQVIISWTESKTTAEIIELLAGDVPVGPVNDMSAIYADPHVAARHMLVEVEQPDGSRPVVLAGQPIKMTKSFTGIRSRPPLLGEHTAEILAEAAIGR